eukprot:m.329886 g.329886  ORF g.329886 m.329886 type:complete len:112 (-) comp16574_c0_seq7:28-363(-)
MFCLHREFKQETGIEIPKDTPLTELKFGEHSKWYIGCKVKPEGKDFGLFMDKGEKAPIDSEVKWRSTDENEDIEWIWRKKISDLEVIEKKFQKAKYLQIHDFFNKIKKSAK